MNERTTGSRARSGTSLSSSEKLEIFKFYEEAAEKTKAHAWTQTAWILTLNAGVIAFSLNLYLEHADNSAFLIIELVSAGVGIVLCWYLFYVLSELGSHISNYWTFSNKIAAGLPALVPLIGDDIARQAKEVNYRADFPRFCKRLQALAMLFLFAHFGWALFVTVLELLSRE
jgi:hypothetical protein